MGSRCFFATLVASLSLAYACSSQVIESSAGSTGGGSTNSASTAGGLAGAGGATSTSSGAGGCNGMSTHICSAQQQAAVEDSALQAPIMLPGKAANIALGMTLAQAEQIDCQSYPGIVGGDGGAAGTGTRQFFGTVFVDYDACPQVITHMDLTPDYTGTLEATSRDSAHKYVIAISVQITKDGQPFVLDCLAGLSQNPAFNVELNELHDALMATYAPGVPSDPDCQTSGHCKVYTFGELAFMILPELGVTFWAGSLSVGQPACSTFNRIELGYP